LIPFLITSIGHLESLPHFRLPLQANGLARNLAVILGLSEEAGTNVERRLCCSDNASPSLRMTGKSL
jgi:hypothetical protein